MAVTGSSPIGFDQGSLAPQPFVVKFLILRTAGCTTASWLKHPFTAPVAFPLLRASFDVLTPLVLAGY